MPAPIKVGLALISTATPCSAQSFRIRSMSTLVVEASVVGGITKTTNPGSRLTIYLADAAHLRDHVLRATGSQIQTMSF
jgi:hypothetical protein